MSFPFEYVPSKTLQMFRSGPKLAFKWTQTCQGETRTLEESN